MISIKKLMCYVFVVSLIIMFSGCTTATYGETFQLFNNTENVYSLKIYIGGFSGGAEADKAVKEEIKNFMEKQNFNSYEIVDRRHNLVPSYFEYHVRFKRN